MSAFLLLILSSPSGAGKTTLSRKLQDRFADLRFSVSHTTRTPRANEVEGRDYHFVTRPEFEAAKGTFLEWAQVHGNLYGTSLEEIEKARATPGCGGVLFDIDYQGARQIRAKNPEVVGVFILPPSMQELLSRLRGRGTENAEALERRFTAAKLEIEHYALFDYVLVTDDLERAFATLQGIVLAERARRGRLAPVAEALLRRDS
jgi:guanylate kinase